MKVKSKSRHLKQLAEQVPQVHRDLYALDCAPNDDADWRASTTAGSEFGQVIAVLRPQLEPLSPTISYVVHGVGLSRPMFDAA